jgi:hypothetical protein
MADALAQAGVTAASFSGEQAQALDRDGFVMLRGIIAADALDDLRTRFEAAFLPPERWPMPREAGMRHAMLQDDPATRAVCLSPVLLAGVAHLLPCGFFLSDAQGRDPLPGGGHQQLHRDWPDEQPCGYVQAMVFLDPFGAANGATRLLPGTQNERGDMNDYSHHAGSHPRETVVEGAPGDVLLMHGRLVHSGRRNDSGAPRRSWLVSYRSVAVRDTHRESRDLRDLTPLENYLMGVL